MLKGYKDQQFFQFLVVFFLMLFLFSLAVFVHVSSLKFYERKNVLAMQQLEDPVISGGGAPCYLSFTTYMKLILAFCAVAFMWIWSIDFCWIWRVILIGISIVLIVALWWCDRRRNKPILDSIQTNEENRPSGNGNRTVPNNSVKPTS